MGSRFRDWAGLPLELLHVVLNKLASYREYRSFSLVCKPWLSVVLEHEDKEILSLRPLLLMNYPYLDDQIHIWLLGNIMNNRKYRLWLTCRDFKSISGCGHGWLACVDEDNNLSLMNPWFRRTIRLPPLQFEFGSTISKVVLSDNPDSAPLDCLVAAIFGDTNRLAFTKLGRDSWTNIDRSLEFFKDTMFDGDRILAIDLYGCLISFYPRFDLPCIDAAKVERVVPRCMRVTFNAYIVRSCRNGAILMIRRGLFHDFEIFKLVKVDGRLGWEEIDRLEDETLLVGLNHSVSVSCIGIFSALPNWVFEVGLKVDNFWDCGRQRMEERPSKKPRGIGMSVDLEGLPSCPPKLDKLFCLGEDF